MFLSLFNHLSLPQFLLWIVCGRYLPNSCRIAKLIGLCDSQYYMYADEMEFVYIYLPYKTLILFVDDGNEVTALIRPVVSINMLH